MSLQRNLRRHVRKWKDCKLCSLHKTRNNIVFFRAVVLAPRIKGGYDFCLLGEAPGESEDSTGLPFDGPAGDLLDSLLDTVFAVLGRIPSGVVSNLVCCVPLLDSSDCESPSIRPPSASEVEACRPRLLEFISIVNPRLIVTLGKTAAAYRPQDHPQKSIPHIELMHPAGILRRPEAKQRVMAMLRQMDNCSFGNCTNHRVCESACPKEVSITHIARFNREFLKAGLFGRLQKDEL